MAGRSVGTPGSPTSARPGRPRREQTSRSIHQAALELLRRGGPGAVTIEAIAAESGVAKTTIYRRHADREAVLRAALEAVMTPPREAPGDTPREKIRWALDAAWRQTAELLGRGGLSALVAGTRPQFSDLFRSVLTPYTDALADLIRADAAAGTLRPDLDVDAVVSLLFGAYLGELVRRGQVSEGFSERCVDLIWAALVREGGSDR